MKTSRTFVALGAAAALVGFFGTAAHAAIGPVTIPEHAGSPSILLSGVYPDATLNTESVDYVLTDSTHATLTVAVTHDTGAYATSSSSSSLITSLGLINLTVHFTKTGSTFSATDGSIDVSGDIGATAHDFFDSSTLLKFGFTESSSNSQTFEFLFDKGGSGEDKGYIGMLVHTPLYAGANGTGGQVIPNDNFNTAFTNSGMPVLSATSDTFTTVPEPASLALLGLAAPLFLTRRRRSA